MKPEHINDLASVSDPQLSPDGSRIAYVVSRVDGDANRYRSRVWMIDSDGTSIPRPVSAGEENDASPRWSPDGRMLAFTSTRRKDANGKTRSSVYLLSTEGPGEASLVAEHDEGVSGLTFSPDGRHLAYAARVRGPHYEKDDIDRRPPRRIDQPFYMLNGEGPILDRPSHIHVVPTDGSAGPRDITPDGAHYSSPAWDLSGTTLVAAFTDPKVDWLDTHLHRLDLDGGAPTPLTDGSGSYDLPAVSPDGGTIAVIGFDDNTFLPRNSRIGLLTEGNSSPRWIDTDADRDWMAFPVPQAPHWDDDGSLWGSIQDSGGIHLYRLTSDGSRELILGGERWITAWSRRGDTIAFTASSPAFPSELFVLRDGSETRLTTVTDAFVARARPRPAERFSASSGDVDVDAWIYTPPDFDPAQKYPMLLNIHGGPHTQYGDVFFDEAQIQADAGFVVVMANPRGSSGRDDPWGQAIKGRDLDGPGWGSVDYDDLMAVVDTALERYSFIDADRLGVLGGSYGGYMTSWIIGHDQRFKAACSERAVNNLASLNMTSDISGIDRVWFGVSYLDDPEEYARMSPISYVAEMTTPLLIIHSDEDLRCPFEQADQLYFALRNLGREPEYYRFPGETHELSRSGSPVHRVQRADLILEFFTRHLMEG